MDDVNEIVKIAGDMGALQKEQDLFEAYFYARNIYLKSLRDRPKSENEISLDDLKKLRNEERDTFKEYLKHRISINLIGDAI